MSEKLYVPLPFTNEVTPLLLPEKNHGVRITKSHKWFFFSGAVMLVWVALLILYVPFTSSTGVNVTLLVNLFGAGVIAIVSFALYRAGVKNVERLELQVRTNQDLYEERILKPFIQSGYSAPELNTYELRSLLRGHSVPILTNETEPKTVILVQTAEKELVLADYSTGDYSEARDSSGKLTSFPAYSVQDIVEGK